MAIKEFLGSHDSFKINYIDAWQFEIGECYMDHRNIVYLLDPKYGKFASNMRNILNNITYEDERMELFFSAAIPHILKYFETTAGEYCIIIRKPKETYPLRAVLKYFKGEIDGKHVAWIIQRLLDIEKFLNYNNIVHNGISIDNIFISPINHIVTIYGGWWYATPQGEKMIGTNTEIFNLMSKETKEDKLSTCYTDLVSIKNIGRKICGEEDSGFSTLPEPMLRFLYSETTSKILEENYKWVQAKEDSYGKPKFVEMFIDINKIYKTNF